MYCTVFRALIPLRNEAQLLSFSSVCSYYPRFYLPPVLCSSRLLLPPSCVFGSIPLFERSHNSWNEPGYLGAESFRAHAARAVNSNDWSPSCCLTTRLPPARSASP